MRSRPQIELHMPPFLRAGDTADARVVLHEATETPVNAIRVVLRAQERIPDGKQSVAFWALTETAVVAKDVRLTPGRHEYSARFTIPRDAPLTHVGQVFNLAYSVLVHVDIPWWPDVRDSFEMVVGARARTRPAPRQHAQTTASGTEPFIELSLDDTIVQPGETLSGEIAAGHLEGSNVRRIRLALVIQESGKVGRRWLTNTRRYTEYYLPPGDVASGAPVRFTLKVPRGLPAAFESATAKVVWWFEARIERAFRSDLVSLIRLDVGVFTSPRAKVAGPRALLGTDRWRQRWAEAGARYGLALDDEELLLRGEIGGVGAHVAMDGDGVRFAVDLRFPSLGLGLEVARRRLPFGGVDVDDAVPTFGRRFRVSAREAAQARAVLSIDVRRYLVICDEAHLDDASAQLFLLGADRDAIGTVVDFVDGLARALGRVAGTVPPPAAMAAFVPAWARFAESNHGVLFVGAMRVEATLGGAPFQFATEFDDDKPIATRISARIDPALPAAIDVDDAAELGARPREVLAAIGELRAIGKLSIGEERIELFLAQPLTDPEEHAPTLATLFRLIALLHGRAGAGPYR